MIRQAAPDLAGARVLDDGCGIGAYVERLRPLAREVWGLDFEPERVATAAHRLGPERLLVAAAEALPFVDRSFDLVLSNEVIEHVADDRRAVAEMVRVLGRDGRAVIFCPNRWYPVEQHGIYWRGSYHFGNMPLVNYLPNPLRNRLAPHVRTYTRPGLLKLFDGLPVEVMSHRRIFGGYDNLVARFGVAARALRGAVQGAERSPLQALGLSHLLVVRRID